MFQGLNYWIYHDAEKDVFLLHEGSFDQSMS